MNQVFVSVGGLRPQIVHSTENDTLLTILDSNVLGPDAYIVHNGKLAKWDTRLVSGETYHIIPRVFGGKGGFGSMLRALGAQIEKTTNREACRDISGRRMRDVNNEQKLREWVAKASDREREKEQKRRERMERRRAEPRHVFDDPEYTKQKMQVTEDLEDALKQGLHKASTSATATCTVTRKRKSEEPGPSNSKKAALEWLGVDNISDLETDSDCDSDDDDHNVSSSARAGPSSGVVPDSGAVSGASSHTTECEEHSDSGVESVTEPKPHSGSPMDVDSDSSAKDSAMNSDGEITATNPQHLEVMQMDHHALKMTSSSDDQDTSPQRQHRLLEALEAHKARSEQTPQEPPKVVPETVDLMSYQSVAELEYLGLDNLKAILMSKAMKCGGTLSQRAERLWAVRGLPKDKIDPSLLAKPLKGKKK